MWKTSDLRHLAERISHFTLVRRMLRPQPLPRLEFMRTLSVSTHDLPEASFCILVSTRSTRQLLLSLRNSPPSGNQFRLDFWKETVQERKGSGEVDPSSSGEEEELSYPLSQEQELGRDQ